MTDLDHGRRIRPLVDLCETQIGLVVRPGEYQETGVPVVGARDIVGHRVTRAPDRYLDSDGRRGGRDYRLKAGDVLLTRSGTVGRVALVTETETGWLNGPHLIRLRVRARAELDPEYLATYLSASAAQGWFQRVATGSAVRHISTKMLGQLPVRLPPLAEQHEIGRTLAALDEKVRAHEEVVRTTRALRGALADLLASGDMPDDGIAFFR
ncbi:restriction endonuclease subunit S [Streptomyces sp. NPDC004284]|uniref:restriction endonuclease subunit S n=1 Tax=Streptomyces sp. NPDC004284 TaxID=3364695 RepID=UPI0036939984